MSSRGRPAHATSDGVAAAAPACRRFASATRTECGGRGPLLPPRRSRLLDCVDQVFDLDRVRAEVLGEPVLVGRGYLEKARLVDIRHDLDADCLELVGRLVLELEGFGGLRTTDLVRGGGDPFLLLVGETLP